MGDFNCGRLSKGKKLVDAIDAWANDKETLKLTKDPYEAAFRLFERDFYVPLEYAVYDNDNGGFLTNGRIQMFNRELWKYNDRIASGDVEYKKFWAGSGLAKKDPAIGFMMSELQKITNNDSIRRLNSEKQVNSIIEDLKIAGGIDGVFSKAKFALARKQYADLDLKLMKAIDSRDNKAISLAREEIKNFTKKSSLKIFDEFIDIIEKQMPLAIQEKYNRELRLSQDESLGKKRRRNLKNKIEKYDKGELLVSLSDADQRRFFEEQGLDNTTIEAVIKYNSLMGNMYDVLKKGIEKRVDIIIDQVKRNRGIENPNVKILQEMKENIIANMMPKYKEDGYFPHYVRDLNTTFMDGLMPHFEKLGTAVDDLKINKELDIDKVIANINNWVSSHAKTRNKREKFGYSRNFIDVVKGYVDDVNHFNTTSFMDGLIVDARNKVEQLYGKKEDSFYAQNVTDIILDMHHAANGNTELGENTQAAVRTMLAFQFISKIGINPRSALRNSTQRLLDYVQFGRRISKSSFREIEQMSLFGEKAEDVNSYIDKILNEAGLLFEETTPELLESTVRKSPSAYKLRTIDENGNIEYQKESLTKKFANATSWVAAKTSWMHRKVENSNRRHTFKIAYAQMHKLLRQSSEWNSMMSKKYEGKTDAQIASSIKSSREKIASEYAKNMVIANHFDYGDYAKAKFMRGGPKEIGRFMFQFQHYGMEFLEKNISIAREAGGDWAAFRKDKDFSYKDAEGLHKAQRMAIAYFMAPVALMYLLPVNLENLVEHHTYDFIKKFATLFTGDEEEISKAFYGKGALVSSFGGPMLSDVLDLGVAFDLINADMDGLTDILIGVDTYTNDTNISDTGRKLKILNTFTQRSFDRHIPMLAKGNLGMAIQQEAGLYPTDKAKTIWGKYFPEIYETKKKSSGKKIPSTIYKSLRRIERESMGI